MEVEMNETPAFVVSAENVSELVKAFESMLAYLHWMAERKDMEAVEKLIPAVEGVGAVLMDIMETNNADALNIGLESRQHKRGEQ
jgi:hypothetical protein